MSTLAPSMKNHAPKYRGWTAVLAIALALGLLLAWFMGYGPNANHGQCCGQGAALSTPAPIAPAPAPAPPPVVVAPAPAVLPDPACADKLQQAIGFASGSTQLSLAGKAALDSMVDCLKAKPATIIGHTDNTGVPSANQVLSEQRAASVKAYLISKSVPADVLTAKGMGDTQAIADNASAEGRAKNRRMEIKQ